MVETVAMAATPVPCQAPIASYPEPAEKVSSEVAVEDVRKQYELMKPESGEPGEKSFIWPEGKRPDIAHDHFDFELHVIDLSPVLKLESLRREIEQFEGDARARSGLEAEIEACEATKSDVLKAIRAACEEHGFFQIINSGFPMEVVDQVKDSYRQIFDLPLEEKMKVINDVSPVSGKPSLPGYMPMKRNPPFNRMNPSYTWNEGFGEGFVIEPPEKTYPARMDEIANILWPGGPESNLKGHSLRSSAEEYVKQSSRVIFLLLDLMVASLGIPEETVNDLLGDRHKQQVKGRFRVNNFPICDHPELTWGLRCHTDPDIITLLHQDAVGGLQIRFKDGTWHGVQPRAGAFVINCGDFLQAWTNGRFLSAEHRVVANEKRRRMSIAYFTLGETNYVIRPRPECVDAEHPLRYRPFTSMEYFKEMMSLGLSRERGELLEKAFGIRT